MILHDSIPVRNLNNSALPRPSDVEASRQPRLNSRTPGAVSVVSSLPDGVPDSAPSGLRHSSQLVPIIEQLRPCVSGNNFAAKLEYFSLVVLKYEMKCVEQPEKKAWPKAVEHFGKFRNRYAHIVETYGLEEVQS